jgi:hypothetical protein
MNKLLAVLVASTLVFGSAGVMAADPPKATAPMVKLEKPAGVTADAWAKMTDAEKQKGRRTCGRRRGRAAEEGEEGRLLTFIAAIFMPLTFITGLWPQRGAWCSPWIA